MVVERFESAPSSSSTLITMKTYSTHWDQGKKKGVYTTKTLTKFHDSIHSNPKTIYARTVVQDPSLRWPFGMFAEVIKTTNRRKA
jgi:hypothetical protein